MRPGRRWPGQRTYGLSILLGLLLAMVPSLSSARGVGDGYSMQPTGVSIAIPPDPSGDDLTITTPEFVVRAGHGGPIVRVAPSNSATPLGGMYLDTYLRVFGERVDGNGSVWYLVRLWGVLPGWIRADQTEVGDPPPPAPTPSTTPVSGGAPLGASAGILPLSATGTVVDEYNLRDGPGADANVVDTLAAGTRLTITGWTTDSDASAWYRVATGDETGWIWAAGIDLAGNSPNQVLSDGHPSWSLVAGKGMWLPYPLLKMASPESVVDAASELGLTHLYLEVGSSGGGFYGRDLVDRLLPVAHARGISVVGWVMTSLSDLPADVSLCSQIAAYQTPGGDRLDGIAPDIEYNMYPPDVKAFSQILRHLVGPRELIVGVIYPAGSWIGEQYPIAGILSRSFNVLAPMDYWHDSPGPFSDGVIYAFIRRSVADIQERAGSHYPVAVIGQSYDGFARDGIGPDNPDGREVSTALLAARSAGAIGVSLFQWGTTTPGEWDALRSFRW